MMEDVDGAKIPVSESQPEEGKESFPRKISYAPFMKE